MNNVFLSIIVPTYKRSDNLQNCIESVLCQEGSFELIIVDDNDEKSEYRKINEKLMKKYENNDKIIYLKHKENKNGAAARNTGIKIAKGEYITFLDDDDEFTSTRISNIEKMLKDKNVDFACSGFIIKKNGLVEKKKMPDLNRSIKSLQYAILCQKSFFGTGSNIICKQEIVNKINGFDETFIRHQDMEFMLRVLEQAKTYIVINDFSVIKNIEDKSNVPSFEKMLNIKNKYLNKFKDLIVQYDQNEQKTIIKLNYYELLANAYSRNDKNEIKLAKQFLKDKNIYNISDDIKICIKQKLKKIKFIRLIRNLLTK